MRTSRICSFPGCDNPRDSHGLCTSHNYQWRQRGALTAIHPPPEERFKVLLARSRRGPTECWLWAGSRFTNGYGRFGADGRTTKAHRLSWERAHGPIPDGLCVCHTCDNPPCVNPAHLFLGTNADNIRDRDRKGRLVHGEAHPRAKLTVEDVQTIREMYARGNVTQRRLAEAFGVSRQLVSLVVVRGGWKRVS